MPIAEPVVRSVVPADLPAVARLAGQLVRLHHAFDPQRFMMVERVEEGYARFFARELADPDVVLVCATIDDAIVGYVYARKEPRDWNQLLDACGAIHDVFVDETARRAGVARRMTMEAIARLEAKGVPRVVLHTATANASAQAFFASLGFRSTMIEMTRERSSSAG